MAELPKKILRLLDLSLRGETATIFVLRESEVASFESDASFRQAYPASLFWATTRKRDFYLGRMGARAAIREVTARDPGWLAVGADGRPMLPPGVTASLSHTEVDGKRIAVIGISSGTSHRLGIDIEPIVSPERFAKLAPRFETALSQLSAKTTLPKLDRESLTAFFTVYESSVKAIAQHGLGKATPGDFRTPEWNPAGSADPSDHAWKAVHIPSGRPVEGRVFSFEKAKIALGIA